MHVPSRIHPANNAVEFYEALCLLWHFDIKADEKARLYRLYYPNWLRWIAYTIVILAIFSLFIFFPRLPIYFHVSFSPWLILLYVLIAGFVIGTQNGRVFAPLFLGKDFKQTTRVSPKYMVFQITLIIVVTLVATLTTLPL